MSGSSSIPLIINSSSVVCIEIKEPSTADGCTVLFFYFSHDVDLFLLQHCRRCHLLYKSILDRPFRNMQQRTQNDSAFCQLQYKTEQWFALQDRQNHNLLGVFFQPAAPSPATGTLLPQLGGMLFSSLQYNALSCLSP